MIIRSHENCEDWKNNIIKVDGAIVFQAMHNGSKGYDGIPFKYCPWCGRKLDAS